MDWASLVAQGNLPGLIIVFLLVLATGGVGVAIVSGLFGRNRGIRGDALVKEKNGIEALTNLGNLQDGFIENLTKQFSTLQAEFAAAKLEYDKDREGFRNEIRKLHAERKADAVWTDTLINALSEHTISIPPRPPVAK